MERTGYNIYDERLPRLLPRFHALRDIVVDHIVDGSFKTTASWRARKTERWIWPELRLSQYRMAHGAYEARILLESDNTTDRADRLKTAAAVLRIVWERERDRERCRERIVRWPDLTFEQYRIDARALGRIETLADQMRSKLSQLLAGHGRGNGPGVRSTTPYIRWFREEGGVSLAWRELQATPATNRAWERLWRALGDVCIPRRRLNNERIVYDLPPRRLLKLRLVGVR